MSFRERMQKSTTNALLFVEEEILEADSPNAIILRRLYVGRSVTNGEFSDRSGVYWNKYYPHWNRRECLMKASMDLRWLRNPRHIPTSILFRGLSLFDMEVMDSRFCFNSTFLVVLDLSNGKTREYTAKGVHRPLDHLNRVEESLYTDYFHQPALLAR